MMMTRALLLTLAIPLAAAGCTLYQDSPEDSYGYPTPDGGGWEEWPDAGWGLPDAPPGVDAGIAVPPDGGIVTDDGGIAPGDGGSGCDCSAITTEAVCVVEPTCQALYVGVDCTCYPDGSCSCLGWQFERCE